MKLPLSMFAAIFVVCCTSFAAPVPDGPAEKSVQTPRLFTQRVLDAIAEGDATAAFSAASEGRAKGEAACAYLLGQMHEQGRGVAKADAGKAFGLYEEAAKAGVPEALTAVARCLESGTGTARDTERAFTFWQKAAEAGDPPALGRMALAEIEGHGRPVNHERARKWAETAATARDPLGLWILSRIYEHGLGGVTADLPKAVELCEQAAHLGQPRAMHQMGVYYAAGQGLRQDPVAATGWYRVAAEFGDAGAMASLALAFLEGNGVRRNDAAALELASAAARAGEPRAQYLLGRIFDEGLGVPPAPVFGLVYHLRAAKSGVKEANTAVVRLRSILDPPLVAQAESLAEQSGFHIDPPQAGGAISSAPRKNPVDAGPKEVLKR